MIYMFTVLLKLFLNSALRLYTLFSRFKQSPNEIDVHNIKVVVVMAMSGLGDAIMTTPLIHRIKSALTSVNIVLIASKSTASVFLSNPSVEKVIIVHHDSSLIVQLFSTIFELRKMSVDVFFATQPSNTILQSLVVGFSGARHCIKHEKNFGSERYRDYSFFYDCLLPVDFNRHRVELNLDLLRVFDIAIPENESFPHIFIPSDVQTQIDNFLKEDKLLYYSFIAIHPGGLRFNKHWPIRNYALLADEMLKKGYRVVLVGGKSDESQCLELQRLLSNPDVYNLTGKLEFIQTAALLRRCRCLFSNDTGVMHLASAVDVPIVAIFGPTNPSHVGPYSRRAIVLKKGDNINRVSVDDVLQAFERFTNNKCLGFTV